jgi:uncharacterized membrane protein (UPF0136 family)
VEASGDQRTTSSPSGNTALDVNVLLSPANAQRAAWWTRRPALRRRLKRSATARFLLVCIIAFAVVMLLVGPGVLAHPSRAAVGLNPASDFQIMTWSLEWWPWALGHGVNPLHTSLLWAPSGFSTLWMTTIPAPALLAAPLTLAAGPLVSYNVLMLLSIPLAAGAAYLLCFELSGSFLASLAGGLLFGLSPYMLGHTLSQHLNLVFVFPLPLVALFCVRYVRRKTRARRFVPVVALLLLLELGSSLELFSDLTLFVMLGLAFAVVFGGAQRRRYLRLAGLLALAYVVLLPALVPIAVFALGGAHAALRFAPAGYAVDAANLVVPTPTLLAGALHGVRAVSVHFVGNIGEQDGYLGVPLILLALVALVREWRRGAWIAGALLLCALIFSFGPTLTIAGHPLLGLPFALAHLPIFSDALPARISLFAALCAAVLAALCLARIRRRWLRYGVLVLVLASALPNFWPPSSLPGAWAISSRFAYSTPQVPAGFVADPVWRRLISPGASVLVLPTGDRTAASWWQVESGMRFDLAVPATPFAPPALADQPIVQALVNNSLRTLTNTPLAAGRLRAFLLADHVSAVLLTAHAGRGWENVVARATAARPTLLGAARLYSVDASLRPLVLNSDIRVWRRHGSVLKAWLAYDGQRAQVRVFYRARHAHAGHLLTLSSTGADAASLSVAVGQRGQAAVAFTEYRGGQAYLQVATLASHWQTVTLDQDSQPILSPHVAVMRNGAAVLTWIDEAAPMWIPRAGVLSPGGNVQQAVTLDTAASLGGAALRVIGGQAFFAFSDTVATEARVFLATFDGRRWGRPVTVTTSLANVGHISLGPGDPPPVRWTIRGPGTGRVTQQVSPSPQALPQR